MTDLNKGLEAGSNLLRVQTQKTDRGLHPAQKPVKLMEILIELTTVENQRVLDPFCGCGTTLVAAKNLNRQYLGMERSETYYREALKRLGKS